MRNKGTKLYQLTKKELDMKKIKLLIFMIISAIGLFSYVIASRGYAQTNTLTGQERSARIDIYTENMKFDLAEVKSNGSVKFADWLVDKEQKKHWLAQMGLAIKEPKSEKEKWQELWVEFTPSDSGFVFVNIRGSYFPDIKVNHHEVWVDDVEVEGTVLKNGSFEEINSQGNSVGWGWPDSSKDKYSTDGTQARTGKSCILVWHDSPLIQKILVKAGQKYRVSAWFKPY